MSPLIGRFLSGNGFHRSFRRIRVFSIACLYISLTFLPAVPNISNDSGETQFEFARSHFRSIFDHLQNKFSLSPFSFSYRLRDTARCCRCTIFPHFRLLSYMAFALYPLFHCAVQRDSGARSLREKIDAPTSLPILELQVPLAAFSSSVFSS